jgi:4'-phosphopantetheinyl transferase
MKIGIDQGDVHFWTVNLDHFPAGKELEACSQYLSQNECLYAKRCLDVRRREFAVSRAALRILLSRYYPAQSPALWKFSSNEYGRPEIEGLVPCTKFSFNISHSGNLATLAFGRGVRLGIDIESFSRCSSLLEIAESNFNDREIAELKSHSGENLRIRFFQYWTLKESFLKAVGKGLSLSLKSFAIEIEGISPRDEEIRVTDYDSNSASWKFHLALPRKDYCLAIAACPESPGILRFHDMGNLNLPSN